MNTKRREEDEETGRVERGKTDEVTLDQQR